MKRGIYVHYTNECAGTTWQSREHGCCHSQLASRTPPCRRPQLSQPGIHHCHHCIAGAGDDDLVNVKILDDRVEEGVEVVEQVYDLHRGACRRYRSEANNIADGKLTINYERWKTGITQLIYSTFFKSQFSTTGSPLNFTIYNVLWKKVISSYQEFLS